MGERLMSRDEIEGILMAQLGRLCEDLLIHPELMEIPLLKGAYLGEFESALAREWQVAFALAMSNATTALLTLAQGPHLNGGEVIVAPKSWQGTYGALELGGVTLVKARPDASGNIEVASLGSLLSSRTRAVLAVDWKQSPHDSESVRQFCIEHGLLYLVDSSLFHPGPDRPDVQVVSFGPGKPLCLGEGGAILTDHREIYENALIQSQHPNRAQAENICGEGSCSINGRMHPFAAMLGTALLKNRLGQELTSSSSASGSQSSRLSGGA